jgi:hypothetical protein
MRCGWFFAVWGFDRSALPRWLHQRHGARPIRAAHVFGRGVKRNRPLPAHAVSPCLLDLNVFALAPCFFPSHPARPFARQRATSGVGLCRPL